MGTKTKIIVLHMKEVIYTIVFAVLAIVLILLLVFMFGPGKRTNGVQERNIYRPGVYTSEIQLGGQQLDVQVVVDENHINGISLVNLDETVETMYPLLQSSMDSVSNQIISNQSLDGITYTVENQYTTTVLTNAVKEALEPAKVNLENE